MTDQEVIAEMQELCERAQPVMISFDFCPLTAMAVQGIMRLTLAHPDLAEHPRQVARQIAEAIESQMRAHGASAEFIAAVQGTHRQPRKEAEKVDHG